MIENLFSYNFENNQRISISQNEIYYQLLMYMFFSFNKSLVVVTPTLNEANKIYSSLSDKYSNVFIFPDDDYLTKKAIATSPELMYMRMRFLNNVNSSDKCILICHTNSLLKKLPLKSNLEQKKINIYKDAIIDRDNFVRQLDDIGYNRESLVTNTGEYSVRGFVVDVFPIFEDHPVRIEFFDNLIEDIKFFDENTQLSLNSVSEFVIKPVHDEYEESNSTVLDYIDDCILIYQDYNQIKNVFNSIVEQMRYYDDSSSMNSISDIKNDFVLWVDTIDNNGDYDYEIVSKAILNYNNDKVSYVDDINNLNSFLCSKDEDFVNSLGVDKSKVININISSGFVYNNIYYFSKNDLCPVKNNLKYDTGYKLGKKISSIDKLEIGDYVVHKVNGIGVYKGITTINKNGMAKDYILINYKGDDKLYLPVDNIDKLYKYSSKDGAKPTIHKLNSTEWQKTKMKIKNKIKDISNELIKIYKNRNVASVDPFMEDTPEQIMFEKEFVYDETPDQLKCTAEIKKDLESSKPMDRLLCGDVGYGKTEVMFRVMFKAVMNSKQVMYLCPTTLLSYQQYMSAKSRFKNFPVNIAVLNRYTSKKEITDILDRLKNGSVDIVFGTHRLLSGDVNFKDLGLLVIDEEHRFGVLHKEKIKEIKSNVHVLSVSATPIPRSLQMSLIGVRDLSLIETPPKNKFPVQTYVINYDPYIIREIVLKEKARNGQVFILYNKVEDMPELVNGFEKLLPEVSIKYAHGKLNKDDMQDIMYEFNNHEFDVLVSTTIIENGIDIPNANTMIVMDADRFGLSQLYQIRGRVGRGDNQAYAYLMYDKSKVLTETAIKRLEAIKEFTELGSGYKIAMRDLSIRGAGDLLGREQAGFIDSVGVDMYIELINEELNGSVEEVEENQVKIDDVSNHIGYEYSEEDSIVIEIHQKISQISSKAELDVLVNEIEDRFGVVSDDLLIYMYQELVEKVINKLQIKVVQNDKFKFSMKLEENVYKHINVEDLFIESTRISTKFSFVFKGNAIHITFNKLNSNKHYIYYIFDLLSYIEKVGN